MRDLTKESGDLSGIVALQLYIQSKGGQGTRYVCEYTRDREAQRVRCMVYKRVYLGQNDGLVANIYGRPEASGTRPVAHPIVCTMRWLNEKLAASTSALCRRLEVRSSHLPTLPAPCTA